MIKKGIACLKEYGFRELYIRAVEKLRSQKISYDKWYKKHAMTAEQENAQRKDVKSWRDMPLVSICVPLYNTPEAYLCEMCIRQGSGSPFLFGSRLRDSSRFSRGFT